MQLGHRGGGGADYAGTIGLTHDATVAGCIDRGAANGFTRGSAMLCGEATSLLCLQLLFTGNLPKQGKLSMLWGGGSLIRVIFTTYVVK